MTATSRGQGLARFLERLRALFNLNDPGWGRDAGSKSGSDSGNGQPAGRGGAPDSDDAAGLPPPNGQGQRPQGGPPTPPRPARPNDPQQPPDLGELIGDLNRKLSSLFGGGGGGGGNQGGGRKGGGLPSGFRPPSISSGVVLLVAGVLLALWLASGFFVVQEGHNAVVLRFGKHERTVVAGLRYRLPAPIGSHEIVDMRIQPLAVGRDRVLPETGLNEHAMLTKDENIVEVRFNVQYRITNAESWLFNAQNQVGALVSAAETAVREVMGDMAMDEALANRRAEIAPSVRRIMQEIVDRYNLGVNVVAINMQDSGVLPPEIVRDAFDDVLRADQERERAKNEAEAYANNVVPRAVGEADRITEEAEGYRLRVIAQSEGDAQRFSAVLDEYLRAPEVTRQRLYLETLEEVYRNSSKVLVDGSSGSNLMYLPLDKLIEQGGARAAIGGGSSSASGAAAGGTAPGAAAQPVGTTPSAPASTQGTRRPTREVR